MISEEQTTTNNKKKKSGAGDAVGMRMHILSFAKREYISYFVVYTRAFSTHTATTTRRQLLLGSKQSRIDLHSEYGTTATSQEYAKRRTGMKLLLSSPSLRFFFLFFFFFLSRLDRYARVCVCAKTSSSSPFSVLSRTQRGSSSSSRV